MQHLRSPKLDTQNGVLCVNIPISCLHALSDSVTERSFFPHSLIDSEADGSGLCEHDDGSNWLQHSIYLID